MASFKYYAGTVELSHVQHDGGSARTPGHFSGYPEGATPKFVEREGWTGRVTADRVVEYKANPSRHACDERCLNASGRVMRCECACGGRNHGRGTMALFAE